MTATLNAKTGAFVMGSLQEFCEHEGIPLLTEATLPPWIQWDAYAPGADIPVHPDTIVLMDMKGGPDLYAVRAGAIAWGNGGGLPFVVLRYQVLKEAPRDMTEMG